jgi:glycosyltransferase involved in cell wall biosynthesis
MPTAAVIIPHYNDVDRLLRCLAALMPQVTEAVEVVVVDNASPVSLEAVTQTYPNLRLVVEPQKGAAMARNRGVTETTAAHLFFLDSDCVPDPDWLAQALASKDRADVVGGTVHVFDETPAPRSGAEAFETVFAFDNAGYIADKGFSVTANLLTPRTVFEDVGDFRAGMSEDLDWCQRATAKGYGLVHEDALRVAHPTRSDWAALERKWHRLTDETWGLQGSGGAARIKWAVRALAMPLSALAHLPRVVKHSDLNGATERWHGAMTLIRLRLTRAFWMLRQACGGSI